VEGAVEVDFVHHLGTVLGVGPVPEETALLDDHFDGFEWVFDGEGEDASEVSDEFEKPEKGGGVSGCEGKMEKWKTKKCIVCSYIASECIC
jgi:hypothetical protein